MSDAEGGGEKTEKPTPHRLKEARKKGDVAKSKDLTSAFLLFAALLMTGFVGTAAAEVAALANRTLDAVAQPQPFGFQAAEIGGRAALVAVLLSVAFAGSMAVAAIAIEFVQVGPLLALQKLKPSFKTLNPVSGLKRMFGPDGFAELVKTLIKTGILGTAGLFMIWATLGDLTGLVPRTPLPMVAAAGADQALAALSHHLDLLNWLVGATLVSFLAVAIGDALWQRHRHLKKLRMSHRDIRQEFKQQEGDPLIRSNRRDLHQQWANQNSVGAARSANVLVVNPTHVAIAIRYHPDDCPVPRVSGKGVDALALQMRAAARDAGVPIVRNITLARTLWDRVDIDAHVPTDLFDAMAAIIVLLRRKVTPAGKAGSAG